MTIPNGSKLGRYEIRSQIGAGGMGEVYLAEDTQLHRRVALKILPAELASNRDRMRRFEQEAHAAAALNHPNIAHASRSYLYLQKPSGLTKFMSETIFNFGRSRDGKHFAIARGTSSGDIILIKDFQ